MKTFWNTYKSSILLLAAMVAGGVIGFFWGPGASVLQPIADTFLNLLYCCVVPLIFCSLTAAIAKMQDLAKLRKILMIFLIGVIVSGVIACLFMVAPCLVIDPAEGSTVSLTQDVADASGSMNVLGMFTVGDFPLLFSKSNLLALIVFTVFFGVTVSSLGEKGREIANWLNNMSLVFYKMVAILMKAAPLGLMAYFANLTGTYGSDLLKSYGRGLLIYYPTVFVYFFVFLGLYAFIAAGPWCVKHYFKEILTPALTALGTRSSAAALPMQLDACDKLGVPRVVSSVVVPVGATCHMDGAPCRLLL